MALPKSCYVLIARTAFHRARETRNCRQFIVCIRQTPGGVVLDEVVPVPHELAVAGAFPCIWVLEMQSAVPAEPLSMEGINWYRVFGVSGFATFPHQLVDIIVNGPRRQ